jgi:hypothetical protein
VNTLTFDGLVKNTIRQTVDTITTAFTTTNYWFGLNQRIEGFNSYDLVGKPVAVSFIFNTNLTGTYSVALRSSDNGQSYVTSFSATANTPTKVVVTIPAIPANAVVPKSNGIGLSVAVGFLNQDTYQTATVDAWQVGNKISASGATIWSATVGNFIELTELQLEEGTVATPFERRPYGVELALCQRYYEKSFPIDITPANGTTTTSFATASGLDQGISTNNRHSFRVRYKVTKRASASLVMYGNSLGEGLSSTEANVDTWSTGVVTGYGSDAGFSVTQVTTASTYLVLSLHWSANSEL